MIKILIPQEKRNGKTTARGLWKNNLGRVCYDYLRLSKENFNLNNPYARFNFYNHLEDFKRFYNQEAIFYVIDKIGYCYYNKNKIEILPHRIFKEVLRTNLKTTLKDYLKKYSGLTIYNQAGRYFIEVFTTI